MSGNTFLSGMVVCVSLLFVAANQASAGVGSHSGVGHGGTGVGHGSTGVGHGGGGVGLGGTGVGHGSIGVGLAGTGVGRGSHGVGLTATGVGRSSHGVGLAGTGVGRNGTGVGRLGTGLTGGSSFSGVGTSFAADGANGGSGLQFPHLGGFHFGGNSGITSFPSRR